MIINQIPREEDVMREEFGQDYIDLEKKDRKAAAAIEEES
jgi:hypothetical protein